MAEDCPGNPEPMGVSRTIVIDPKETPTLGGHQYNTPLHLEPKEFILTLDDGPVRKTTPEVLDFLKKECAKATYFLIGVNSLENPDLVRRIAEEGHTIGTHTQTHAYLSRIPIEKAQKQIDDGFRSAQAALDPIGKKVSPFFPLSRFDGHTGNRSLSALARHRDRRHRRARERLVRSPAAQPRRHHGARG